MLLMLLAAVASTLLSPYPVDALMGTMGRNNGLILLLVYGGVYFMVTRWRIPSDFVFAGLALCSCFVSTVALLNFFNLDPLRMLGQLTPRDSMIFISTIGNKNLLSSYLCIILPVVCALFVHTRKKELRPLYLLSAGVGFAAMMCADSDSGFLGLGAFCLMGLLIYIRKPARLKRFLLVLTVMLLTAKLLFWFAVWRQWEHRGLGALQSFILFSPVTAVIQILLALLTTGVYYLHAAMPKFRLHLAVQLFLITATVAVIALLVWKIYYYTVVEPNLPLEGYQNWLRLDDDWGTHRGFIWRRSVEIFREYSWKEKLLGSGPDTFYGVFQPYFQELSQFGDSSTNAAHNEYIHYLVTQGLVGAGAYVLLLISSMIHALRCARKDTYYLVFLAGVVGYAAQALVNIAQPITTPLFILFLALAAKKLPPVSKKVPYILHSNQSSD
jgi:hypothetical protein